MEAELPDLLDLLRVAVEAGLPVGRALGEVGGRHGGPLAREWRATARELALGVPRDEALRGLVRRCPPPAVATLAAALRRAERHGAPLAATLAAQAAEARAERARRIREHAAKAAPKIQLVVALLLVPSVLLLVAAALVGAFVR
jgi:tight adherence protein C